MLISQLTDTLSEHQAYQKLLRQILNDPVLKKTENNMVVN